MSIHCLSNSNECSGVLPCDTCRDAFLSMVARPALQAAAAVGMTNEQGQAFVDAWNRLRVDLETRIREATAHVIAEKAKEAAAAAQATTTEPAPPEPEAPPSTLDALPETQAPAKKSRKKDANGTASEAKS